MKNILNALILAASLLALSACATHERFYTQDNFAQQGIVSDKTFDQVVAECRYHTLRHNALMDVYELEIPRYKACMQSHGYLYQGE